MIIVVIYCLAIFILTIGLIQLPKSKTNTNLPLTKFSIVIPFRNEEQNLNTLLNSISNLNYPSQYFEVFLIDDDSSDSSVSIIEKWQNKLPNIHLLQNKRLSNSPKKDALNIGIKQANFNWIITTDADCIIPKNWLHFYNTTLQVNHSLFICGPITINTSNHFLHQYQYLDCLSLIGVTMGGFGLKKPMMCNAANMGFHKATYLNIQKKINNKTTSGDDIFTLESFAKKYPKQIHYLNNYNAAIKTNPENTLQEIINQRVRWAAKSTHYNNKQTQLLGLVVLVTQITLIITPFLNLKNACFLWLFKISIDCLLISITRFKLKQKVNYLLFIITSVTYPILNSYIGIRALFGGYVWKNRKFNR